MLHCGINNNLSSFCIKKYSSIWIIIEVYAKIRLFKIGTLQRYAMIVPRKDETSLNMLPVIFALAWPTMLEQFTQTAVQYIDTAMVGAIGTHATAAVGSTTTINWLVNGTISALGVGFLSFVARSFGAGKSEYARRIAGQSVSVVLVSGLFFTCLALSLSAMVPVWMQVDPAIRGLASTYFFILYIPTLPRAATIIFGTILRAAGDTKTPMRVGLLVNFINIVLNYWLIYPGRTITLLGYGIFVPGADMGVAGAATASATAVCVGGILITIAFWRHPLISPRGMSLRPDWTLLSPCLKIAMPNVLQRFTTYLGYVPFAAMINSLGETSAAAHTIANTVESAFYIPGYGMQAAASTLAGNALGGCDDKKLRSLTKTMILVEAGLMTVSGGLLYLFAPEIMRVFSRDYQVIMLGSTVLRMVSVTEPFFGMSIVMEGILLGTGDTIRPFLYSVFGMWGIRIIGTFLCTQVFGLGLIASWTCMIIHNLALFSSFLIYILAGKNSPLHPSRILKESDQAA